MFNTNQRTLKNRVSCIGIGLHTGLKTAMALCPAEADTGIVFKRTDIQTGNPFVPALYNNVTTTTLGTTIANADGVQVGTIEHLMAALWGCGIDNAIIELDAPEVPIMDGSSEPFVFLIDCAGVQEQDKPRQVIEVLKEVSIEDGDKIVTLKPSENFSIGLSIEFANAVIGKQKFLFDAKDFSFKTDLSRARSFGFEHEVNELRKIGLARGGSLENAIVVSSDGSRVLNKEGLRYVDEFARHKVLDCIGDFYLAGGYIKGQFHASRSGHALNNKLLRKLFADPTAWRMVNGGAPTVRVQDNYKAMPVAPVVEMPAVAFA